MAGRIKIPAKPEAKTLERAVHCFGNITMEGLPVKSADNWGRGALAGALAAGGGPVVKMTRQQHARGVAQLG